MKRFSIGVFHFVIAIFAATLFNTYAHAQSYNFIRLDFPETTGGTFARGINARSQIVGAYFVPGYDFQLSGFLYDRGEYTRIAPTVGGAEAFSEALGINAKGQIVGYYYGEYQSHGFIYEDGIFMTIDVPFEGATDTAVSGIKITVILLGRISIAAFARRSETPEVFYAVEVNSPK